MNKTPEELLAANLEARGGLSDSIVNRSVEDKLKFFYTYLEQVTKWHDAMSKSNDLNNYEAVMHRGAAFGIGLVKGAFEQLKFVQTEKNSMH